MCAVTCRPEEAVGFSNAEVGGACEPPDMDISRAHDC